MSINEEDERGLYCGFVLQKIYIRSSTMSITTLILCQIILKYMI